MEESGKLTALLEFDRDGKLEGVFLNCNSDQEQKTLKGALSRLIQPSLWDRIAQLLLLGR